MIGNGRFILVGIAGIVLGAIFNNILRSQERRRILTLLRSELNMLLNKQNRTPEEEKNIEQLKSELYLMKFRCTL